MQTRFVKKSQIFFGLSFLLLIGAGTLLLRLPLILKSGGFMSWGEACFTATSAVSLTGLSVISVESLTILGQIVILALVQLGGIGIMALSAAILLGLGTSLGFSGSMMLSSTSGELPLRYTKGHLQTVIRLTFISELIGAVLLFFLLLWEGQPFFCSLWNALFLSVSSFCNAGIPPVGLIDVITRSAPIKILCSLLCVLGSLGSFVIYGISMVLRKQRNHLLLHAKVVLFTSLFLLVAGTLLFRFIGLRGGGSLSWLDSWFLAASTRTCGLPAVDVNQLTDQGLLLAIILMLIGGAPGSTAGGIKVAAIGVAAAAILNTCAGNRDVLMFRQKISTVNVLRSFTIIILFVALFCVSTLILRWITPLTPGIDTMEIGFETASALSTTGLSIGRTTEMLPWRGRIFLMILMYVGRIGPFAMMLSLMGREKSSTISRPEGVIIIS